MAQVVFVNEHLVVDAHEGRALEDVARAAGVLGGGTSCFPSQGYS